MKRKAFWRSLAVVALLGVSLSAFGEAKAGWSSWSGQDIFAYPQYYTTHRTVNYSPYGIALYKDDGPAFQMTTWSCGDGGWTGGQWKSVPNADPSGWVYLKGNNTAPTNFHFCLAIVRNINDYNNNTYDPSYYDTFDGSLNWDGPDL